MRFAFLVLLSMPFLVVGQAEDDQGSAPRPYVEQGPFGPTSLSVSRDSALLASGDLDGIRIYNLYSGREILTLPHYAVDSVAFSPDGKWLASAGRDQLPSVTGFVHYSVRLWPIAHGAVSVKKAQFIDPCSPSTRIGAVAFAQNSEILAIACDDQQVVLWNLATKASSIQIKLPSPAKCLQFSPDGTSFATGLYNGVTTIWTFPNGAYLHAVGSPGSIAKSLAYTPDGKTVAVARSEELSFWDVATGSLVNAIAIPRDTVDSIAFQGSSNFIAAGGYKGIAVFDARTGQASKQLDPFFTAVTAVTYKPNGSLLAGAAWSQVIVWNSGTWDERYNFHRLTDGIVGLRLSPDRKNLLTQSSEIKVWDYQTGLLLGTTSQMQFPASQISPDYKHIASIAVGQISVYRTADGVLERKLPGHDPMTTAIAFGFGGKMLASGGVDGLIRIWDLSTSSPLMTIDTNDPDRLIEVAPGFSVADPHSMWKNVVGPLVFSADDQQLAGVASNGSNGETIRIWDVKTGHEVRRLSASFFVSTIAFDPSGKQLASADDKGRITLWDLETETPRVMLTAGTSSATSLLFDSGRQVLLSGSANGETLIWDLSEKSLLMRLVSTGPADWLTIAPNGLFDGTPDAMREVGWKVAGSEDVFPLESFYNDFFEPAIYAKTMSGHQPKPPLDLQMALQLPGLREMLKEELVSIETRNGQPTLCLAEAPTVTPTVFRDAQPMHFDPQSLIAHPEDPLCRFSLTLDRNAQYEVVRKSEPQNRFSEPTVGPPLTSTVTSSTLNLQTVAIERYNLDATGLRPLPSSVLGAMSVEAFFRDPRQKSGPYRNIRVWDGLYDQAATRKGILNRLREIGQALSQDDVFVLFLSGHGIVPAGQEMFYFAPFDFEGPDPRRQRETGLNTAVLVDAIRNIPATRVVIIIDACQSGGAIESLEKVTRVKSDTSQHPSGSYLVASATPLEQAIAPVSGNDALVSTLLTALRTGSGDQSISIRDVTRYVRRELPLWSSDPKHHQTPMIAEAGVDFPIAVSEKASLRK